MSVEARQHQMLEELVEIPVETRIPFRSTLTRNAARVRLGRETRGACAWFADPANHITDEWEGLLLTGAYHILRTNVGFRSSGAEETLRTFLIGDLLPWWLEEYGVPNGKGSENHVLVKLAVRFLLEQLAGQKPCPAVREQLIVWCQEKALRGHTEYFSPHYTERATIPLLELYDHGADETVHAFVRMALDQYMAEHALIHINGFRGGAMRRYLHWSGDSPHEELGNGAFDCNLPFAQIQFEDITGLPPPSYKPSDQHIGFIFNATTSYRVPRVIQRLADLNVRGEFTWRSGLRWNHDGDLDLQAPNAFLYASVTPHYVLSSIRRPEGQRWGYVSRRFEHGTNSGLPWRLSLRDPYTMLAAKRRGRAAPENTVCDPEDAQALFQYQNTVIYVGHSDALQDLDPPRPADAGFERVDRDGPYCFYLAPGADGTTVYAAVFEANGLGALEVGLSSAYGDFSAFKSAVQAAPRTLTSPGHLYVQTLTGDRITIEEAGVQLNDQPVPLTDWPRYDAPWIRADWMNQSDGAGCITILSPEGGELTLDFRDRDCPVRAETSPSS